MIFENVELYNIAETVTRRGKDGSYLSRFPASVREKLDQPTSDAPFFCSGAEIRFNIESGSARLRLARDSELSFKAIGICEIWFGSFQGDWMVSPRFITPDAAWMEISLPKDIDELVSAAKAAGSPWDPRLVRVILPYDHSCRIIDIQGDLSPPRPGQSPERKILCYGSSITHGGSAVRPTETWAMRLADDLGVDLINLGLAGNARLEPAAAEWIAGRRDWDLATLELGINLIDRMETAEFAARAERFLSILATARPEARIFCVDLFPNGMDLRKESRIAEYRKAVKDAVERSGSDRITHHDGGCMTDPVRGLCEGLIHPSARGHEDIARRLSGIIASAGYR